jgi:hypothetical protein
MKFAAEATFAVCEPDGSTDRRFPERDGTTDGGADEIDAVQASCQGSASQVDAALNVCVARIDNHLMRTPSGMKMLSPVPERSRTPLERSPSPTIHYRFALFVRVGTVAVSAAVGLRMPGMTKLRSVARLSMRASCWPPAR